MFAERAFLSRSITKRYRGRQFLQKFRRRLPLCMMEQGARLECAAPGLHRNMQCAGNGLKKEFCRKV